MPDRFLVEPKGAKVRFLKCLLVSAEEFVELRRCNLGTGQHSVHLIAMMDLVLEQMQQSPVRLLRLGSGLRIMSIFHVSQASSRRPQTAIRRRLTAR